MIGISLSSLEKSAKSLAKALSKKGYNCSIHKFVDDSKGGEEYGGSCISLYVYGLLGWGAYQFYTIYGVNDDRVFSGQSMKWSEMKAAVLKDLKQQEELYNNK